MLHAGLDLSRRRLDVCLVDEAGGLVAETAAPPDADGLRGLARRLRGRPVRAVIESMTGARFVHDTLERAWLGGARRRRAEGQGTRAVGVQDRQDRRACLGRAVLARSGAGDLAARPDDPSRARAGPLPGPSGPAPHDA